MTSHEEFAQNWSPAREATDKSIESIVVEAIQAQYRRDNPRVKTLRNGAGAIAAHARDHVGNAADQAEICRWLADHSDTPEEYITWYVRMNEASIVCDEILDEWDRQHEMGIIE